MVEIVLSWLKSVPQEARVVVMAALPIAELRGAIPLGLYYGMPLVKAYWLSVLGNMLPVIPALFLLEPVSRVLRRFKLWAKFFDWLFERTRKKADKVQRYEALGLAMFVAIPLPVTGAWTGVVAATLFKIRFRYALAAIFIGVLCAGIIVSLLSTLGISSWKAVVN